MDHAEGLLFGLAVGVGLAVLGVASWRDSSLDGAGWVTFGYRPPPELERYFRPIRLVHSALMVAVGSGMAAASVVALIARTPFFQ